MMIGFFSRKVLLFDVTLKLILNKGHGVARSNILSLISRKGINNDDFISYYVDYAGYRNVEKRIFNMLDFKTYNITVDFNLPQLVQNKIVELVLEVEN